MLVREKKQDKLQKVRFTARVKPKQLKPLTYSYLHLRVYEHILDSRRLVLDSPENGILEDKNGFYKFNPTQFTTDLLEDGPVVTKTLIIQVIEKYTDYIKKTKEFVKRERLFGETKVRLREIFEKARTTQINYELFDSNGKSKGLLELKGCSLRNFHTFLDLHLKNGLNLVPILAVDYSLANLTFDESQYCIHTLKPGAPNDYMVAIRRFSKAFKHFSRFMLGYGFGARTVGSDKEGPACNLFTLTGDFMDPFVTSEEELFNSYCGTLKAVKLGLPVCFKDVFKLVCDLA
jgi:hypothetical protein